MAKPKTVFYAYSSFDSALVQTIEAAITDANKSRALRIKPWTQMRVAGRIIVTEILSEINKAQMFACDLTYPNPNVMFELGYAIARRKPLFLSLNSHIEGARESYNHIRNAFGPDLGYVPYEHRNDLSRSMMAVLEATVPGDDVLGPHFSLKAVREAHPGLLYVRQPYVTDESLLLSNALERSVFAEGLFTDNPKDSPVATLNWYAEKVRDADAILLHLLSERQEDNLRHNLKCALVAGLARGFERAVLMLAPEPYQTPMDYRDLLRVHKTAEDCAGIAEDWLAAIKDRLPPRRIRSVAERRETAPELNLRNLRLGEWVAEHEHIALGDYFVEMSWFLEALESQNTIFVGRRGTGKTATLYALERALRRQADSHICIVKPQGYEVDGIIRLLNQSIDRSEQGNLIESLWKYLLYTELVSSVAHNYYSRPPHIQAQMESERRVVEFYEQRQAILGDPFSIRLDKAVRSLLDLETEPGEQAQRTRISEKLHSGLIGEIRILLGQTLGSKKTVAILIDNLDEPWEASHDIDALSALLMGLLRVSVGITEDLRHGDSRRLPVNASMTVFLRSDIFFHLRRVAAERDKLPVRFISWSDGHSVMRIIDDRLASSLGWNINVDDIWQKLFVAEVNGESAKDFIIAWSMTRPRDAIYFVKQALAAAVNRGHVVVTEEDLFTARRQYSEFAFTALRAEDHPQKGRLEGIMMEFAGMPCTVTQQEVAAAILRAETPEQDVEFYIDLLCDLNFLGVESRDGFVYVRDEGERQQSREVAHRLAARIRGEGADELYEVNRAFHDVLSIAMQ